jgi:tRNA(Ile2) C34 agmatinyltransferase TiaS
VSLISAPKASESEERRAHAHAAVAGVIDGASAFLADVVARLEEGSGRGQRGAQDGERDDDGLGENRAKTVEF